MNNAEHAANNERWRNTHYGPESGVGIGRAWQWKQVARTPSGDWYVCEVSDQREAPLQLSGMKVLPGSLLPKHGFREIIGDDEALADALIGKTRAPSGEKGESGVSGMWESAAKKKKPSALQPTTKQDTQAAKSDESDESDEALELDYDAAEYSTFEEVRKARHEEFIDDEEDEEDE